VKAAVVHLDAADQSQRVVDAIRATASDTEDDVRELQDDEEITRRAHKLLGSRRNDAYQAALAALREDTRQWWEDMLAREPDELEGAGLASAVDAAALCCGAFALDQVYIYAIQYAP
jgi:hypothetical protein